VLWIAVAANEMAVAMPLSVDTSLEVATAIRRLKSRLRPMRGLTRLRSARVINVGTPTSTEVRPFVARNRGTFDYQDH
jgi:hypothetical protein